MENGNVLKMASEEAFNYQSGLCLLLSHIILSQTCFRLGNDRIEDREGFNPSLSSKSVAGGTRGTMVTLSMNTRHKN